MIQFSGLCVFRVCTLLTAAGLKVNQCKLENQSTSDQILNCSNVLKYGRTLLQCVHFKWQVCNDM